MNTNRNSKGYRVEAHGAGVLSVNDGRCPGAPSWTVAHGLTRESAWTQARAYMASNASTTGANYHTVKVFGPTARGNMSDTLVWRAFAQADGTWIDAATALTVAA